MASKATQQESVSTKLISHWQQVGEKLAVLAEAIPENKFEYRPVDSVRTPAEVLRHVAFWNRYVADCAHGRKGDDAANELPKDEFRSKKQIVAALKDTASDATQALKKISPIRPRRWPTCSSASSSTTANITASLWSTLV